MGFPYNPGWVPTTIQWRGRSSTSKRACGYSRMSDLQRRESRGIAEVCENSENTENLMALGNVATLTNISRNRVSYLSRYFGISENTGFSVSSRYFDFSRLVFRADRFFRIVQLVPGSPIIWDYPSPFVQARLVSNRSDIFRQFERVSNKPDSFWQFDSFRNSSTRFGYSEFFKCSDSVGWLDSPESFEQLDVSGSPDKVG